VDLVGGLATACGLSLAGLGAGAGGDADAGGSAGDVGSGGNGATGPAPLARPPRELTHTSDATTSAVLPGPYLIPLVRTSLRGGQIPRGDDASS